MATQKFSRAAYERLQAEFDDLTTRGRIEVAEKIERAREEGDLSENAGYHAAKDEQGHMEGRIRQLEHMLEDAEIADDQCVYTVLYDGDSPDRPSATSSVTSRSRSRAPTLVSPSSPLGTALAGRIRGPRGHLSGTQRGAQGDRAQGRAGLTEPTLSAEPDRSPDTRHPRRAIELPPGRDIELPGLGPLFVRDAAGPSGAPTLVLLHGWTATADLNFFTCYAALSERWRVVAFDHRGHGRGLRSRRTFRLEDCADDAVRVADALGIDTFVPVGYSMGGPVAQLIVAAPSRSGRRAGAVRDRAVLRRPASGAALVPRASPGWRRSPA